MAEQLAENYHNSWAKSKKRELEAKGDPVGLRSILFFCSFLFSPPFSYPSFSYSTFFSPILFHPTISFSVP
jgi:hypothetical protein